MRHTKEWYDAIVQAYLMFPGNHSAVARELGLTRHTTRKVWNEGWTKQLGTGNLNSDDPGDRRRRVPIDWAPPIKIKIAEYQAFARAKLEEARADQAASKKARDKTLADAVESAKADIIDSRALQGRAIKSARANSIALMGVTGNLLAAGVDLSKKVKEAIAGGDFKVKPREAILLLRAIAEITRHGNEAAQIADDMERRALGEPDMILGVEAHMTVEDATREIKEGAAALLRSERLGGGLRMLPPAAPPASPHPDALDVDASEG